MNPYLDDDLRALADQVRRFATERVAPGFQERDRTRVLDRALMREMGALGFIAPEMPERFGGLGTGCLAAGVIHEEIARADLSMSYVNLLASLIAQILAEHGEPGLVTPWLHRLTKGEALLALPEATQAFCKLADAKSLQNSLVITSALYVTPAIFFLLCMKTLQKDLVAK